jgi:hypothetical protein
MVEGLALREVDGCRAWGWAEPGIVGTKAIP